MEGLAENATRLLVLCVPVAFGAVAARLRVIPPEDGRALAGLNAFALHFGFPALVMSGMLDARFELPRSIAFWCVIPVAGLLLLVAVWALTGMFRVEAQRGTVALVALFGNVAFLGLPFVIEIFGDAHRGVAALAVSIHVAIAVGLGPVVLRRWSGVEGAGAPRASALRQPLLWAPLAGLVGRMLPSPARDALEALVTPTGGAAAPVALFLLGVYLHAERRALFETERGAALHVVVRIVLAPSLTALVVTAFSRFGWITPEQAAIFVVLAGMPAAVTTFTMAHDAQVGTRRVAAVVVRSSVIALVTLPLLATVARWL